MELDYYIDLPAAPAPPPPNPFLVFPVANIHPVIGRLATGERWLLAPLADMFIKHPGLQQTRSGRTVQAPSIWVNTHVQAGRGQPGGGQEMVQARPNLGGRNNPSDIDTRGRDSRPPTAESTPGDSGEQGRLPSTTDGILSA